MMMHTKFNLGDTAWFMKNNKPLEVTVSAIEVFEVGTNQSKITYNARDIANSTSWLDHTKLFENTLFKTQGDLVASLFGSVCKGEGCNAVRGVGHSSECIKKHDSMYKGIN